MDPRSGPSSSLSSEAGWGWGCRFRTARTAGVKLVQIFVHADDHINLTRCILRATLENMIATFPQGCACDVPGTPLQTGYATLFGLALGIPGEVQAGVQETQLVPNSRAIRYFAGTKPRNRSNKKITAMAIMPKTIRPRMEKLGRSG